MITFDIQNVNNVDLMSDILKNRIDSGGIVNDTILTAKTKNESNGYYNGIHFTYLRLYSDESELRYVAHKTATAVYMTFKNIFGIELKFCSTYGLYKDNEKVVEIICDKSLNKKIQIIDVNINLFSLKDTDCNIKNDNRFIFKDKNELLEKLNNIFTDKNACTYKNIYNDFKSINMQGVIINDNDLWEADSLIVQIVMYLNSLILKDEMPKIYLEKSKD